MSDRQPAPRPGGATEAFVHERASATPSAGRRHGPRAGTSAAAAPVLPADATLRSLEEWLVAAIIAPSESPALDAGAARVLTRGPALEATERLDIYRYGYRARLVECLADDYPALQHALGEEAFERLCHAYIERHPSASPSLNAFGRHMELFCRTDATALEGEDEADEARHFAADLAALEWALVEVLHAGTAPPLSLEALSAIAPEAWASARLAPSDAVRVVRSQHAVNAFFQAFKAGELPCWRDFGRVPSATAVYRTDMTLWRMDLTPAMAGLLEALFAGRLLGEALEALDAGLASEEAAEAERSVMAWFRAWVSAGFFAGVELA
jgi:hypothetical protein